MYFLYPPAIKRGLLENPPTKMEVYSWENHQTKWGILHCHVWLRNGIQIVQIGGFPLTGLIKHKFTYIIQHLHVFTPFAGHFAMIFAIFPWFSHDFLMFFPWFSLSSHFWAARWPPARTPLRAPYAAYWAWNGCLFFATRWVYLIMSTPDFAKPWFMVY